MATPCQPYFHKPRIVSFSYFLSVSSAVSGGSCVRTREQTARLSTEQYLRGAGPVIARNHLLVFQITASVHLCVTLAKCFVFAGEQIALVWWVMVLLTSISHKALDSGVFRFTVFAVRQLSCVYKPLFCGIIKLGLFPLFARSKCIFTWRKPSGLEADHLTLSRAEFKNEGATLPRQDASSRLAQW
jgi:hypothetical protein